VLARCSSLGFVVGVLLLPAVTVCLGQVPQASDSLQEEVRGSVSSLLQEERQLVKAGQFQRAIRLLRPLFADSSTTRPQAETEKIAYWLGRAYLGRGQSRKAFTVLREGGTGAMEREGTVDPRVADAFIREVMSPPHEGSRELAARAYLRVLGRSGQGPLSSPARAIVHRHLREVAVILPDAIQERTGISFDADEYQVDVEPTPDAGEVLVGWWRQQDPIPATLQNERIYEHLQRVMHARENFSHEGRLDDRGRVYIRFGEPHRDVSIGMKHVETQDPIDTRLRRNQFWTYHHVHPKAYYLFVEIDPPNFQLSGAHDLFPPDMKTGTTGATSRSQGQALKYLYRMEDALRELATFHEDYTTQATDVSDRAAWARDNEQFNIGSDPVDGPAGNFVQSMESRIESMEHRNAKERTEKVPQSYTTISEGLPDLPIASRTARFLTSAGKTRIEVYWSAPTSALALTEELRERTTHEIGPSPTFMVRAVAVRETEDHADGEIQENQFLVESSERGQSILPPQSFSMVTSDSLFHIATQWGQYSVRKDGEDVQVGRILRRRSERRDTLTALSDDPETLEMSDLKLLTVPDEKPLAALTSDNAISYPFEQVRTEADLALTFQAYHLGLDESGRTRYTVSYGARQETDDGGFLGLFGGDDEKETRTTTTYEGDGRRTDEYIVLNLDDFTDETSGTIDVTVTLTDKVTGRQVERSISIETVASDDV